MAFEIVYQTEFAAAHAIVLPDGSLEPVHGHNWSVTVTVTADALDAIDTVMDFHDLERIVLAITGAWHNRNLNDVPPFVRAEADAAGNTPDTLSRHGLSISPTAERVAEHLGDSVAAALPGAVRLLRVAIGEAPGCTAVYRPA
ncbi:MAG: 6-pyruvoyl trahydropterin synthase family protein [Phycisphaerales bacterium JB063]